MIDLVYAIKKDIMDEIAAARTAKAAKKAPPGAAQTAMGGVSGGQPGRVAPAAGATRG